MHPLVGLNLGGATLTPFDDCVAGSGALGKPVWGPEQLLRDLELRLGLPSPQVNDAVRTARWAQRMSTIAAKRRFYTGSFDVDPLGTAASVLALRDALIEAGWDGTRIEAGGARLDAIAELEALTVSAAPALPAGLADRLVAVVRSLDARDTKLYDALTLAEPLDRWPLCWQRILGALEHNGTRLSLLSVELPCAAPDSDLGKVQAALFASTPTAGGSLLGDGTFLLVTAETSLEAARAAAALLAQTEPTQSVVIRERDAASLEHALFGQGLPSQGLHSSSPWRAALQVLPLALELAFEPKDPYRVLELLSLPNGPFTGGVGRRMVRALSRSPGIGSQAWEEAKERIPEPRQEALQRITEWFETTGSPPSGAAVSELLKVVERVRRWLVSRVAGSPEDSTLHVAVHQCEALVEALVAQPGDLLDLVHVRRLSESVTNTGASLELVPEHVGRISHVSTAQALWSPRATVLWWPFVQHYERPPAVPWRRRELDALERAGITFPNTGLALLDRAASFRRCVRAATERLILMVPRTIAGQAVASHALWDEIVARMELDDTARANVTLDVEQLLQEPGRSHMGPAVRCEQLPPLALPQAHARWHVRFDGPLAFPDYSASSLSALLGCPLSWALNYLAGLSSERLALPEQHLLSGMLGHRLIEELDLIGAFEVSEADFIVAAEHTLGMLFEREGAPLLRAGKAHERDQLWAQLLAAAWALRSALADNELRLLTVEQAFAVPWRNRQLRGRWDVLAEGRDGQQVVIDVKWGHTAYRQGLIKGTSVQLATYTYALQSTQSTAVAAAYFSLSERKLFGHAAECLGDMREVNGPPLTETWARIERTVPLVEQQLTQGRLAVCGTSRALPLLEELGLSESEQTRHFAVDPDDACKYCQFDAICGRRWETG